MRRVAVGIPPGTVDGPAREGGRLRLSPRAGVSQAARGMLSTTRRARPARHRLGSVRDTRRAQWRSSGPAVYAAAPYTVCQRRPGRGSAVGGDARGHASIATGARRTSRWMSGMRARSHSTRGRARAGRASATRACPPTARARWRCGSRGVAPRWMTSASNTMLVIRWRANRSWPASRRNPLKPHWVSGTSPVTQSPGECVEHLAQEPPVQRLAGPPVGAVRLDPAAERDVVVRERVGEQRELVGRCCHVRVGETPGRRWRRGRPPGPRRPCLHAVAAARAGAARRRPVRVWASGRASTSVGGAVRAAVVHDQHVPGAELGCADRPPARAGPVRAR